MSRSSGKPVIEFDRLSAEYAAEPAPGAVASGRPSGCGQPE